MCVPTAHNSRNISNKATWNHLVTTMLEKANQKLQTICKTFCCVFLCAGIWTYLRAILTPLELCKESGAQAGIRLHMRESKLNINTASSSKPSIGTIELKFSQLAFTIIRSAFNHMKLWQQHIKWIPISFEPWKQLMFWLFCSFKRHHLSFPYYRALIISLIRMRSW